MANNFTLSPEERLMWQQRAPHASYWFGVSDTHPFIHGGQPIPALGVTPPPPPYASTFLPTAPTPVYPSFSNSQPIPSVPQITRPEAMTPFPLSGPVPIYDVCHKNNVRPATPEDSQAPLPLRKLKFNTFCQLVINNTL